MNKSISVKKDQAAIKEQFKARYMKSINKKKEASKPIESITEFIPMANKPLLTTKFIPIASNPLHMTRFIPSMGLSGIPMFFVEPYPVDGRLQIPFHPIDEETLLDERIKLADLARNTWNQKEQIPLIDQYDRDIRYDPLDYGRRMKVVRRGKPKVQEYEYCTKESLVSEKIHLFGITQLTESKYYSPEVQAPLVLEKGFMKETKPKKSVKFNNEVEVCFYPTAPVYHHSIEINENPYPKNHTLYNRKVSQKDKSIQSPEIVPVGEEMDLGYFCNRWSSLVKDAKIRNCVAYPKSILKNKL